MHPVNRRILGLLLVAPLAWAGPAEERSNELAESEAPGIGLAWIFEGVNRVDVEGEALIGSDITVLRTSASYEQKRGDFTVGATLGYTDIDIDYRPQTVTREADRIESNREGQLDLGWQANEDVELTLLGRLYQGYPDYRSVWIAEYYEQRFGGLFGYQDPDPWGWAIGGAVSWTVVPGMTVLTFEGSRGEDHVVESWSATGIPFPPGIGGDKGRGRLETSSASVSWEQVVNGWLKAQNTVRIREVTDREPRFQVETGWAAALGPKWTLRANAGATRERPHFEAYYAGASLDYEFLPSWHLAVNGRYYEDTGEIETAGLSTAAPALRSFEVGASLLYDRGDLAVRLSAGFFRSDHGSLDPGNVIVGELYRDRDWWLSRMAVSYSF